MQVVRGNPSGPAPVRSQPARDLDNTSIKDQLYFYLAIDVSLQQGSGEFEAVGGESEDGEDQPKGVDHASQQVHALWISFAIKVGE